METDKGGCVLCGLQLSGRNPLGLGIHGPHILNAVFYSVPQKW